MMTLDETKSMYNLDVATLDNFYVGEQGWLVHNTKPCFDYKEIFFTANPELRGHVYVHHGIEQQTLTRYPGLFTDAEIHDLTNLRGIPDIYNNDIHLSQIRKTWNQFYNDYEDLGRWPTKQEVLDYRTKVDGMYGDYFAPVVRQP